MKPPSFPASVGVVACRSLGGARQPGAQGEGTVPHVLGPGARDDRRGGLADDRGRRQVSRLVSADEFYGERACACVHVRLCSWVGVDVWVWSVWVCGWMGVCGGGEVRCERVCVLLLRS